MKKAFLTIPILTAGLVLAMSVAAAGEKGADVQSEEAPKGVIKEKAETSGESDFIAANRLIGMKIESSTSEEVGEVSDLLLHQESGRVAYLIVSGGGFLGIGDDRYIVPFSAVKQDQEKLVLNVTRKKLAEAPPWEPGMSEEDFEKKTSEFFGVSPYWDPERSE